MSCIFVAGKSLFFQPINIFFDRGDPAKPVNKEISEKLQHHSENSGDRAFSW